MKFHPFKVLAVILLVAIVLLNIAAVQRNQASSSLESLKNTTHLSQEKLENKVVTTPSFK